MEAAANGQYDRIVSLADKAKTLKNKVTALETRLEVGTDFVDGECCSAPT